MLIFKLMYHILAVIQKFFFKIVYRKRLNIGKKTTWRKGLSIMISDKGTVDIGESCFFNNYCSINANEKINIGAGTIVGENVKIYDHNHKFRKKDVSIKEQGYSTEAVSIGKNCWIGSNVVILKGALIEDNCVIGAGNVIDCKVPHHTIIKRKDSLVFEKIQEEM